MLHLRAFSLLFLAGFVAVAAAAGEELKGGVTKMVAIDARPSLISVAVEPKSRTEKRESDSKQTALLSGKSNDEPFRPIFGNAYKDTAQLFRPTTVRYVSAEAVTPQNYYEKAELTGGIQYATPDEEIAAHSVPAATMMGGITYASSAYRAPYTPAQLSSSSSSSSSPPSQQQQLQHHHQQQHRQQHLHALQAVKIPAHYSAASAAQIHAYNEDLQQQQQQQQRHPQHQQQQQQQAEADRPAPSHPLQYVIAIPLSYVRQLQQQLSGGGGGAPPPPHATHAAYTQLQLQSPSPLPHPMLQHYHRDYTNGMYRVEAPHYTAQYIQLPVSTLGLYSKPLYYMQPPAPQLQPQPHQHHQTQPIYAYALQQHHQLDQPHQQQPHYHHLHQQQQPQVRHQDQPAVRIGIGPKTSAKIQLQPQPQPHQHQQQQQQQQAATYSLTTPTVPRLAGPTPNPPHPSHSPQPSHSPFVHYNPIYVQAPPPPPPPPPEQAAHAAAQSFARFVQTYPDDVHSPRAHYFMMPQATPQFYAVPPPAQHRFKLTYQQHGAAAHAHAAAIAASVPTQSIPIYGHAGSVHYGTHLYHPHTPNYAQSKVLETHQAQPAVGNHQQPQQHLQQQQPSLPHPSIATPTAAAGNGAAARSNTLVKYP